MRVVENRIQTGDRSTEEKERRKNVCWSSAIEVLIPACNLRAVKKKRGGGRRKEESLPLDLDSLHLALDSVVLRAEETAA